MDADAKMSPALPLGARIWAGLRIATFATTGLYVCLMFSALASEESRRFYMWLPLAFGGLLMLLFGIGQWGRWRHLLTLASVPLCLVGFPWFSNHFTEWYINWYHNPFLYIGTVVVVVAMAFSVRWISQRRRRSPENSSDSAVLKTPALTIKIAIVILGVGGLIYGADYLVRSLHGRFEPETIGLNGVKWYAWAPRGFVHDFKWNHSRRRVYYGLYLADVLFWHQSDAAHGGRYPVNEVSREDIWKVYRAWK